MCAQSAKRMHGRPAYGELASVHPGKYAKVAAMKNRISDSDNLYFCISNCVHLIEAPATTSLAWDLIVP